MNNASHSRRAILGAGLALPLIALTAETSTARAATATPSTAKAAAKTASSSLISTTSLQSQLTAKGLWCGGVDGSYGPKTTQAVVVLQKLNGLPRTGKVDARTLAALSKPVPRPHSSAPGIEIHKDTETLWSIGHGQTLILDVSTANTSEIFLYGGRKIRAVTPNGSFHVTHYINGWHKSELGEMYRPYYFDGGIAIHGDPDAGVLPYPASHGCCRISEGAQDMLIATKRLAVGTSVRVSG